MGSWTTIAIPIDRVTLLEDRAHVVRRATLEVPAGTSRWTVEGVSPALADRTLSASATASGRGPRDEAAGFRVTDVQVRRRHLAAEENLPEDARELRRQMRELKEREALLERRMARYETAIEALGDQAAAALEDAVTDASWERLDTAALDEVLARLAEEEDAARRDRLAASQELLDVLRDKDDLRRQMAERGSATDDVAADLRLQLSAAAAGTVDVRVDYVVPGACWRPAHRARLEPTADGADLAFATDGCVWQNTGEDWEDVQLRFSTERPSLGTDPPDLHTDLLRVQRRSEVLDVEMRELQIQTTGPGAEPREGAGELPGIDDGGEVLTLRALHRADVPSDGRPHRVRLGSFSTMATTERVVMAELAPAVLLRSEQVNRGEVPILAGPVDLVRGGGFVGRTSVLFVAPGERFELGWGPDGAMRVRRELERSAEDSGMLSSWISRDTRVTLKLTNLGTEQHLVTVRERVPVSEIDKVRIEVRRDGTTGARRPDDDGIVTWTVDLQPDERERVELTYTIKRHQDVVGL